jgi:hypothetical protein
MHLGSDIFSEWVLVLVAEAVQGSPLPKALELVLRILSRIWTGDFTAS